MLDRIIDIHCHILPDIDDGPKTLDESMELVIQATQQGIRTFIATPHFIPDENEYEPEEVLKRVRTLQDALDRKGVKCKIFPGMELYLTPKIIQYVQEKKVIPLGGKSRYFLVEFPESSLSMNLVSLLHEFHIRGYIPIVAHPERNGAILRDPLLINSLLEQHALLQVTASSIIGRNGKQVQKVVHDFIQSGLVSFVASDAHSIERRSYHTDETYQLVQKRYADYSESLFWKNAQMVMGDLPITTHRAQLKRSSEGIFHNLGKLLSFR